MIELVSEASPVVLLACCESVSVVLSLESGFLASILVRGLRGVRGVSSSVSDDSSVKVLADDGNQSESDSILQSTPKCRLLSCVGTSATRVRHAFWL